MNHDATTCNHHQLCLEREIAVITGYDQLLEMNAARGVVRAARYLQEVWGTNWPEQGVQKREDASARLRLAIKWYDDVVQVAQPNRERELLYGDGTVEPRGILTVHPA